MYNRLLSMLSDNLFGLLGVTVCFSYTHLVSLKVYDTDDIVFFKFPFDMSDTYRENTECFLRTEYISGSFVDVNFSFGKAFTMRDPLLDTGYRFARRNEAGAKSAFGVS